MTEITIMCPECQHIIRIQVNTIDTLRHEIKRLNARIFELENITKTSDLFGGIFGGKGLK